CTPKGDRRAFIEVDNLNEDLPAEGVVALAAAEGHTTVVKECVPMRCSGREWDVVAGVRIGGTDRRCRSRDDAQTGERQCSHSDGGSGLTRLARTRFAGRFHVTHL